MPSARGVIENVLATLVVIGLAWAVSHIDASVQVWAAVLLVAVALLTGYRMGRSRRTPEDLANYQAKLLGDAILALGEFEAGGLTISLEDFIERGILGPAGFGLSTVGGEQIRLSVLELNESGEGFRMLYEAGHSLGRKDNFFLSRASLAGHAFETKELQWTDNVEEDRRWQPHPKASDKRGYRSLASMPIVVGDGQWPSSTSSRPRGVPF